MGTNCGSDLAEAAALVLSGIGSAWLLWVCSPRSRHLYSRQLWHLSIADLARTALQIGIGIRNFKGITPSKMEAAVERALLHFCLFAVCLVEALIAAGVALSGFHSVHAGHRLAQLLPFLWVLAAICEALDILSLARTTKILPTGDVTGSSMVLGIAVGVCFASSVVLYVVAMVILKQTSAPRVVMLRRSRQALAYILVFFLSMFPTWLLYLNVQTAQQDTGGDRYEWADTLCAVLFVSNGWLNAVTRIVHDRRLHIRRDNDIGAVNSPSLCVGFGHVSTLSNTWPSTSAGSAPGLHSTMTVNSISAGGE